MNSFKVSEIAQIMESVGLPCAYYQFNDQTDLEPPFLCWFFEDYVPVYADDSNYADVRTLSIELYTNYKDFETEESVEDVLRSCDFTWSKAEDYLDSERMYITVYSMDVLINKEDEANG